MHNIEIFEGDIVCEKFQEKDGTINPYYYVAKYDKELFCYGLIDFNDDFTPLGNHSFGIVPEEINEFMKIILKSIGKSTGIGKAKSNDKDRMDKQNVECDNRLHKIFGRLSELLCREDAQTTSSNGTDKI